MSIGKRAPLALLAIAVVLIAGCRRTRDASATGSAQTDTTATSDTTASTASTDTASTDTTSTEKKLRIVKIAPALDTGEPRPQIKFNNPKPAPKFPRSGQ